jgi:hypothetical protein
VWYRLLGRAVLKKVSKAVSELLLPHQYAVGVSCGTDECANLAQLLLKKHGCVINVDVLNAFNSMRRYLILLGIREFCPTLERLFYWSYDSPTILVNSAAEHVGMSETGVRQGDPLSCLFFCCGLQHVLLKIQSRITESSTVFAYSDDTNVSCSPDQVEMVCNIIIESFGEAHLELVPDKCTILCSTDELATILMDNEVPFPIVYTSTEGVGRLLVGNPIGGTVYRTDTLKLLALKHTKVLPGLVKLRVNEAYLLLKLCINPRMVYLARINNPIFSGPATTLFDSLVDKALFRLCCSRDVSNTPIDQTILGNITTLRSLPLDLGGLAIMSHSGLVGQKGYLSSFNEVRKFLQRFKVFDGLETLLLASNPPVRLGLPVTDTLNLQHLVADESSLNAEMVEIRNNISRDFHTSLLTRANHPPIIYAAEAAMYASSIYEGSGSGFSCAMGKVSTVEPNVFRECLRSRMLITLSWTWNPQHYTSLSVAVERC